MNASILMFCPVYCDCFSIYRTYCTKPGAPLVTTTRTAASGAPRFSDRCGVAVLRVLEEPVLVLYKIISNVLIWYMYIYIYIYVYRLYICIEDPTLFWFEITSAFETTSAVLILDFPI